MLRVGLTGGIGSGKSTVARALADNGATVIDADRLAREVVAPGTEGLAEIVAVFGTEVVAPDGSLDRKALAARVFADDEARCRLNAIVHPRVGARTAELTRQAPADAVLVHDVPLLVENGLAPRYHLVIVVDAPVEERIGRLARDRGMTEAEIRARLAAQANDDQRRAVADVWLDNGGGLADIRDATRKLWSRRLVPFEENLRLGRPAPRVVPHVVPYDPTWPVQASRVVARLRAAAGELGARVDHVGPTSVPGLATVDVLDVQFTVRDTRDVDALARPLSAAGFPTCSTARADTSMSGDLDPAQWFIRSHQNADPSRSVDVHVRVSGTPGWRYGLLMPAWLRADERARAEYEARERRLTADYAQHPVAEYTRARGRWLGSMVERADRWARTTGWTAPVG